MGRSHQNSRYKALGWFALLLVSQLCAVVVAAQKETGQSLSLPAAMTVSSEYDAFLKRASFVPSAAQHRAVESLFTKLKERHITIKPSLHKLLALAGSDLLIPLCQKTDEAACHHPLPCRCGRR